MKNHEVVTRKEYIERGAVMQKFADHVERSNNSDFAPVPTWNQAVQIVEDFHAADVAPVVRCGECRYAYDSVGGWCCSYGVCVDCIVREDFFCADGARMDGDGE